MTNLNDLANDIYLANKEKGFWDEPRSLCETTMLIVTELSEAVEEDRAGRAGVWYADNGKPEGIDIELIDALIRLLDLLGSRGVDVDDLLKQKLSFNESRPARHGKAY